MYQSWVKRGIAKPGKSAMGLAEVLGIGRTRVYKLIAGTNKIKPEMLLKISKYIEEPIPKLDFESVAVIEIEREIGVGVWFERDTETASALGSIITPRDFEFPRAVHHAYLFKGDSMDREGIFDGNVILCIETDDELQNGRLVVIERDRGGVIEVSARKVFMFKDRVEYRTSSNNETYAPIVVPNKGKSGETVTILSVVRRTTRDFK